MQNQTITFQVATHHLPKVALRLEYLLQSIEQACVEQHPVIHHYALKNLIEILKIIEKPELKSRFLKELMRIEHLVGRATPALPKTYAERLYQQILLLGHVSGRFGEGILHSPFLQSVKHAHLHQITEHAPHEPQLSVWLEGDISRREHDLHQWNGQLQTLRDTIYIYLTILRDNAQFSRIDLYSGFYQRQLPTRPCCHLVLVRMDKGAQVVPKIQMGHHGLTLRLLDISSLREVQHIPAVVDLAVCQL
ncbi:Cell division protein ZapD [Legionella geestiana]|uniref:Cell division protein ZapD n=1 Tax=Legionella geestiana TaxID=45065 RepID=A0A0W0TPA3_9GAMM|nr:cell division protein ZapD [Legionella geestiana]KTC97424.1 Cell division protein ZapD [Legionella geestiana]QBS11269.1 cell division protein ZapD [Legionella geestiana]QDQ40964.1 cell division protein ZapD [Legionella geestiana]STX54101.1 Protein of uncharacterised function (DUF1342) [Legionella geestiana]